MSVTDLRDQQNDEWHAWAERDPDRVREHNRRRRDELAKETSGKKVRLCEFVSDEGMPCLRRHKARGYCNGHYWQIRRGEELRPLRGAQGERGCAFTSTEGARCDRPHKVGGYCNGHAQQVRRGVDLKPLQGRRVTTGALLVPPETRNGEPWAEWEFDLAMSDTPLREVALRLGRTYSSVVRARQRRRKMLGLDITYLKTDSDPYDGSSRAGVLYMKEAE